MINVESHAAYRLMAYAIQIVIILYYCTIDVSLTRMACPG